MLQQNKNLLGTATLQAVNKQTHDSTWFLKDIQFGKIDHTVCLLFPPGSSLEKVRTPDNDRPKIRFLKELEPQ